MKERPILFSGPMICAINDGRKTQTRRLFKRRHASEEFHALCPKEGVFAALEKYLGTPHVRCPYGQPGDRLWVRETLRFVDKAGKPLDGNNYKDHLVYAADGIRVPRDPRLAEASSDAMAFPLASSVPSIHMPRWASRITLEITGVRVERLQDISEADSKAEGASFELAPLDSVRLGAMASHRGGFERLWQSINGPDSWTANPWVWVIEFKRVTT